MVGKGSENAPVVRERPYKHHVIAVGCDDRGNARVEELWEEIFRVWFLGFQ